MEAEEREIISKIIEIRKSLLPFFGSSSLSRKRKRESRAKQPCFTYVKTGSCKWGLLCKFAHVSKEENKEVELIAETTAAIIASRPKQSDVINSGRSLLRALQDERMQRRADDDNDVNVVKDEDDNDDKEFKNEEEGIEDTSLISAAQPSTYTIPSQMSSTTYLERYFSRFYVPDAGSPPFSSTRGQDHYVHLQSNRICIIGITPSHPAIRHPPVTLNTESLSTLTTVSSSISSHDSYDSLALPIHILRIEFSDFLKNITVSGKKKRGAVSVTPSSILATVFMSNGTKYTIRACIHARVFELNTRLLCEPELLSSLPLTMGYVAILQVQPLHVVREQQCLLNEVTYSKLLTCRGLSMNSEGIIEEIAIEN